MTFSEALSYLDRHINLEARAGNFEGLSLDSMTALMALSGDPHRAYRTIHVTGTNGKGSTATMIARILQEQGLRVGRYSSPHLESITERIEVDAEPISREDFGAEIMALASVAELSEYPPSYFELLTAAAYRWFAEVAVDVAVVEVGVLGRFDATNVIEADVAVVTNIGRDHTEGVGEWRRNIAHEKAGIAKPTSTLVVGERGSDVLDIFEKEGAAELVLVERDFELIDSRPAVAGRVIDIRSPRHHYDELFVSAHGAHQAANAAVAVVAVEEFFDAAIPEDVLAPALGELALPGRAEVVASEPVVVLDGAHNRQAAQALAETLTTAFGGFSPRVFVLAALAPRNPSDFIVDLGVGPGDFVVAVPVNSPRSVDPAQIVEGANAVGATAEAAGDTEDGLERARVLAGEAGIVVVTGSMYAAGEARHALAFAG